MILHWISGKGELLLLFTIAIKFYCTKLHQITVTSVHNTQQQSGYNSYFALNLKKILSIISHIQVHQNMLPSHDCKQHAHRSVMTAL